MAPPSGRLCNKKNHSADLGLSEAPHPRDTLSFFFFFFTLPTKLRQPQTFERWKEVFQSRRCWSNNPPPRRICGRRQRRQRRDGRDCLEPIAGDEEISSSRSGDSFPLTVKTWCELMILNFSSSQWKIILKKSLLQDILTSPFRKQVKSYPLRFKH